MPLPVRPPHRLAACTLLTLLAALLTGWSRPADAEAAPAVRPPGSASAPAEPAREPPWVAPLAGPLVVTRPFQPPAGPYGPGHRGVDLAGVPGEPVRSAGSGRVSYAGLLAGRGVVSVDHGRLRTTYEPVQALVRPGATVTAGQVLGRLVAGHAGCPVAACLHWGLLRGPVYLDPMSLLTRAPPVLLPLQTAAVTTGSGAAPDLPDVGTAPGSAPRVADDPAAPTPDLTPTLTSASVGRRAVAGAAALTAGLLLRGSRRRAGRYVRPRPGDARGRRPAGAQDRPTSL